ncbi:hypothetical protein PC116_g16075 [Phytophthora cactorum]|nr:hypothetical protein Pcac1_g4989 [Phytophthora cactorum]KAG2889816.1 hypothetical protein PC114_g17772 [Phytophthora cactorum]KAG3004241.1 hypothetical protein PC120_g18682 [Phytophthora cactorum]KAG3133847.1 hypothetical protein C6341_g22379 [Phytophthora cactorum]KAG3150784.1 hypothetical protein PC128_g23097 [Phytophthora cactorum]
MMSLSLLPPKLARQGKAQATYQSKKRPPLTFPFRGQALNLQAELQHRARRPAREEEGETSGKRDSAP